ncbi:LysR substrate-binding domain-containing protein [Rhodoplanes sp. TEM]|uniref:LysR substrate-binding domain-containing protein n=1 Tax=Rhodoplanes tepidamans TaxID=200616 RepID=A0ABT5JAF9_RHOTP|nr:MULTISPECIES: LysR substrate-binding domain-containing protein [Rhodoplanes]MDC7786676.1 LysR substrate-binding domain-containing protein [Rhodoplanes tepidamans]MDC7982977.1 LysR substrate-binding domain-containing protein [Rhodoplanes sp. TEM]MDQ0356359.1 DNA-binding transcriptional LysR family regulator [Rhodoplanes tepidamans]
MEFELRHLEAFRAVAETRSMTAAARLLGVSQPAVSSLIARFEQQIGLPLFRRTGGGLEPTAEALQLVDEVAPVLADFDHVRQAIHDIRDGRSGRLMIAAQPLVGLALLPAVLADFARAHPRVSFKVLTNTSELVRHLLSGHAYDLGIADVRLDAQAAMLASVAAPCVCVLPADHRLASYAMLTPTLLDGEPFVTSFREREIHHRIGRAFADAGAQWNVVAEVDFFAVACGMVANRFGVTVVDPFTAAQAAHAPQGGQAAVAVRAFAPALDYRFALYHPLHRPPSTVARAFVRTFLAAVRAVDGVTVSGREPGP